MTDFDENRQTLDSMDSPQALASIAIFAMKTGCAHMLRSMGKMGIDFSLAPDDKGISPLHRAECGPVDCLRAMLESKPALDAIDHKGRTSLHRACKQASLEHVEILLQAGASLDLLDAQGRSALAVACARERGPLECALALLGAGADPNAGRNPSPRPLALAIEAGSVPLARALLDAGARIEGPELAHACWNARGGEEMAMLLLARGADPEFKLQAVSESDPRRGPQVECIARGWLRACQEMAARGVRFASPFGGLRYELTCLGYDDGKHADGPMGSFLAAQCEAEALRAQVATPKASASPRSL